MGFGSSIAQNAPNSDSTNTEREQVYFKWPEEALLRILNTEEFVYWRYYMRVKVGDQQQFRSIVVGPGDTPIKRHFEQFEKSDERRVRPGKRMLLNVLDRTPVKKVGNTPIYAVGAGVFPATGPNGENLSNVPVEPNNKVYVLDFGSQLMTDFATYHQRVRKQKTFEPLNIWDFDVRIISIQGKEPKDVKRSVMPGEDQEPLPEELKASLLMYDLSKVVHPMPDAAQQRLLDGEDLLTILKELNWDRPVATIKL